MILSIFRISPYGLKEVLLYGPLLLALGVACFLFVPMLAVVPIGGLLGFLWFFRDPVRRAPDGERLILSPADGKVVDIQELVEGEYLEDRAVRIGIFLSVFNVHVNRSPVDGQVEHIRYREGKFKGAFTAESTRENESNAVGILASGSVKVLVRQVSGAIARRIVCPLRMGERLAAGQRFGMIKFGSRTEVYLPATRVEELRIRIGSRVKGGQTVLGVLKS